MKKTVIVLLGLGMFTGILLTTYAVVFSSENGEVTFSHNKHREILEDCKQCHENKPSKINRAWAHKTCMGCHAKMKKGPMECGACHMKQSFAPRDKN